MGQSFFLRASEERPPIDLMTYARYAVLQEHDLEVLLADAAQQKQSDARDADALPLRAAPLSPSNEDAAFRFLAVKLEAMLAAYPTTIDEDEYALSVLVRTAADDEKAEKWSRRGAAIAAALLEKRLLSYSCPSKCCF